MPVTTHHKCFSIAAALAVWCGGLAGAPVAAAKDAPITAIRPAEYGFFSKEIDAAGIPIKAHQAVADAALLEAQKRIARMLAKIPVARQNLVDVGAELHIIGKNQQTSDLPYLRHWKGKAFEGQGPTAMSIDERTRGVGGLAASCGEENLLRLPSDRYTDHRDICTHEFAHNLFNYGLSENVRELVRQQFKKSIAAGLWKTAYAATNVDEFFAELSMWYFGSRGDFGNISPTPQAGRAWLRHYDPQAFDLLYRIYSGRAAIEPIAWQPATARPAKDEGQLRSLSSAEPAQLLLVNESPRDYSLFWLDFKGKRQPYGTLHAGERLIENTFATHPWLVARPDGRAVEIFIPETPHAKAVIPSGNGR
jgi:VHL beta domain